MADKLVTDIQQTVQARRGARFSEQRIRAGAPDVTADGRLPARLNNFAKKKQQEIRLKTMKAAQNQASAEAARIAAREREAAKERAKEEAQDRIGLRRKTDPKEDLALSGLEQARDIAGAGRRAEIKEGKIFKTFGAAAYNQTLRAAFTVESEMSFNQLLDVIESRSAADPNGALKAISQAKSDHLDQLAEVAPDIVHSVEQKITESANKTLDRITKRAIEERRQAAEDSVWNGYEVMVAGIWGNISTAEGATVENFNAMIDQMETYIEKNLAATGLLTGKEEAFRRTQYDRAMKAYARGVFDADYNEYKRLYNRPGGATREDTHKKYQELNDKYQRFVKTRDLKVLNPALNFDTVGFEPIITNRFTDPELFRIPLAPKAAGSGGTVRNPGRDNTLVIRNQVAVDGDASQLFDEVTEEGYHGTGQRYDSPMQAGAAQDWIFFTEALKSGNANKIGDAYRRIASEGMADRTFLDPRYLSLDDAQLRDLKDGLNKNWFRTAAIDKETYQSMIKNIDARIELIEEARLDPNAAGDLGLKSIGTRQLGSPAQWLQDEKLEIDDYKTRFMEGLERADFQGRRITQSTKRAVPGMWLDGVASLAAGMDPEPRREFLMANAEVLQEFSPGQARQHIIRMAGDDAGAVLTAMYIREAVPDPDNDESFDEQLMVDIYSGIQHADTMRTALPQGETMEDTVFEEWQAQLGRASTVKPNWNASKLGQELYKAMPSAARKGLAAAYGIDFNNLEPAQAFLRGKLGEIVLAQMMQLSTTTADKSKIDTSSKLIKAAVANLTPKFRKIPPPYEFNGHTIALPAKYTNPASQGRQNNLAAMEAFFKPDNLAQMYFSNVDQRTVEGRRVNRAGFEGQIYYRLIGTKVYPLFKQTGFAGANPFLTRPDGSFIAFDLDDGSEVHEKPKIDTLTPLMEDANEGWNQDLERARKAGEAAGWTPEGG